MKRMKGILLFIFLLVPLLPGLVYAHGCHLILEAPGVLRAEYDGGGFSPRMVVTLYDAEGKELASGSVDDQGKYHFDASLDLASAVVEDGMGHRAVYEKGVEEKHIPKLPVVMAVFLVVGIIMKIYDNKIKRKREA